MTELISKAVSRSTEVFVTENYEKDLDPTKWIIQCAEIKGICHGQTT